MTPGLAIIPLLDDPCRITEANVHLSPWRRHLSGASRAANHNGLPFVATTSTRRGRIADCVAAIQARKDAAAPGLRTGERARRTALSREAIEKVLATNQGIIVQEAKRYLKRCKSLEFEDLMQYGNIGMIRALEKFEPERGFAFTTYAYWWVRAEISRAVAEKDAPIYKPVNVTRLQRKIDRATQDFLIEEGRTPTTGELALLLNVKHQRIKDALSMSLAPLFSLDAEIKSFSNNTDGTHVTLLDRLASKNESPIDAKSRGDEERFASSLLRCLKARERQIIEARFWDGKTLEELGQILGVTRERIRQIEAIALDKLRAQAKRRRMASDAST
jgi:RNA polymerase primary sigma factor